MMRWAATLKIQAGVPPPGWLTALCHPAAGHSPRLQGMTVRQTWYGGWPGSG